MLQVFHRLFLIVQFPLQLGHVRAGLTVSLFPRLGDGRLATAVGQVSRIDARRFVSAFVISTVTICQSIGWVKPFLAGALGV